MDIALKLSEEFKLRLDYSKNIIELIDEGNTIPFIARYRKEQHGTCDDQVLREFSDRLVSIRNLLKRKEEVMSSIQSQEKWTDELAMALEKAVTMTEVEDIYRPYKQKKKTRASVAIEKGLQPLADIIFAQLLQTGDIAALAAEYIDEEKGVASSEDAVSGAKDIIAEMISDDAIMRKSLRSLLTEQGLVNVVANKKSDKSEKSEKNDKSATYEMYAEYSEKISSIPSHRILAINRGEADECLKVDVVIDHDVAVGKINSYFLKDSIFNEIMKETIIDSFDRLIFPSISREVRSDLSESAAEQAIKMFELNLKPLLMQPPLKGKVIMGFDPAYRTGCKIAVIDSIGNALDTCVVYPTPPQSKMEEATAKLLQLIEKYKIDVISIGNGTASKESEIFVSELIKKASRPMNYIVVNEAGASVYSASKLGAEEFPQFDVSLRSAVSIARRLLDPLAELIKIDVKSIGVGQYQHDMPQKRLTQVLDGVVEDCVNAVGVDLNTASYSLLSNVSGLNLSIAKNIVKMREEKPFANRKELLKVPKLGPKAFEQSAGFLKISNGKNVLDNTSVHPEAYDAASKLLAMFGFSDNDIISGQVSTLSGKVNARGIDTVAAEIGVGVPTLEDMIGEIIKPGRDIRDELPPPLLRADLLDIKDLKEGMEIIGTVRNVIDFGAFVDIGVHQDGLVHISEICDKYIKHPSEALAVGDIVKVKVLGVDPAKKRISLTMKNGEKKAEVESGDSKQGQKNFDRYEKRNSNIAQNNSNYNNNRNNSNNASAAKPEQSLEDMLLALKNKFKR